MELKRKYREVRSEDENNSMIIKPNGWFRKNFSLAGLYYHLAEYGEDLRRPTFFGLTIISASVIAYLLIQQEPVLVTHPLSFSYKGLSPIGNAFENSTTVFLRLQNEHLVWYDYIFKSLDILTLGIFAIPLRRRFERKFRH
jgi:hypothetical protein